MGYDLIITEKPSAAQKIAEALADSKPKKVVVNGATYYELKHKNKNLVICCAAGHLYTVTKADGEKSWTYPVFDIKWEESNKVSKDAAFTKKFLSVIKKLGKNAREFTIATDYDIEGEVIGYTILKHGLKQKDAKRMKYSTLTKDELINSYEKASKHLIWGQVHAGITRHELDWFYGINLSTALTLAVKNANGGFKLLSIGRVQGPALKMVVDKEKEIKKFVPVPFWQITLNGEKDKKAIEALHAKDKFQKETEAKKVFEHTRHQKHADVIDVSKNEFIQAPPTPFDLTTLQIESHKTLGIVPKRTLEIAQILYLEGLISYPRTSSQKLPPTIGYKKIIEVLAKNGYEKETSILLKKANLKPNEGSKIDEAHPAIYPTGQKKALDGQDIRLYDLIVRRFLATFGDPATRETMTVKLDVKSEIFVAKGTRTTVAGWHTLYGKHTMLKDEELPACGKGDKVDVKKIELLAKETPPPRRYSEASIIKELDKRNLGTKATRAQIVENLYLRGYILEKSVEATELGIRTADILHKYSPQILDEELTRDFEDEMELIRQGKISKEKVLDKAKKVLTQILDDFKEKEKVIGTELLKANRETQEELTNLGPCPKCKKGDIHIRRGKFGVFAACDKYPDCKTTFNLPKTGVIKPLKTVCETCCYPMISVKRKRGGPQELCINKECATKKPEGEDEKKEFEEMTNGKVEKECPKCQNPLVIRSSVYGKFLGCSNFPKCKYIEKLKDIPHQEDFKK